MAIPTVAGPRRPVDHSHPKRRIIDKPIYQTAIRAERVIIAGIAALTARAAGEDITRGILLLVILMAVAELTDHLVFQHGYRSLFSNLDEDKPRRSRVRSSDTARSRKRSAKRSRVDGGDNKKAADKAHKPRR